MVKGRKKLRICLAASGGGHTSELLKLADAWKGYETFYITTTGVMRDELCKHGRVYVVGECNRSYPFRIIRVFFRCTRIIFKERPDVIVSTGAAPGLLACFLGKLIGTKIVWIDSIANVERLSLSGWLVRPIADLCLVQWPDLADRYSVVEYVGAVI